MTDETKGTVINNIGDFQSPQNKSISVSVRSLAFSAVVLVLMCIAGIWFNAHQHNMRIWHQKDIDFPYDVRYSKLTQPLALVSTTNHFMLLAPKGKLILYCSDVGCIGDNKKELQLTITELFQELANQNRAAQQKGIKK